MFWVNTKRIFKAGFVNFWRNGFVSLAAVLVMTITLLVIASTVFLGAIFNYTLGQIKDKVDVNVYFVTTAPESDILSVKKSLEGLPEVALVTYVSREEALEAFRKRHENDSVTLAALSELEENPLGASLNIRAKDPSQYEGISRFLEGRNALGPGGASIIDKINYYQNKVAIDRLSNIITAANLLGVIVIIALAVLSIVITFNTIRLAIYISREEISVMRLVGASNKYIRGPFVVSGIFYGLAAAALSLLAVIIGAYWSSGYTEQLFSGINLFDYFLANAGMIILLILGSGVILGAVSSYLAVRRYLRS
jgi:cell division transport system permease protein